MTEISEELYNQQRIQMFNICEKPIIEYLAYILDRNIHEICNNLEINKEIYNDPMILFPLKNLNDKYISLNIELVNNNYKSELENINVEEYPELKNSIDFLSYSIFEVYSAIVSTGLKEHYTRYVLEDLSIHLEAEPNGFGFITKYIHPIKRKELMCKNMLSNLKLIKETDETGNCRFDSLPEQHKEQYNNKIQELEHILAHLNYDENEITQIEEQKNNHYVVFKKLGVILKFLEYDELPEKFREALDNTEINNEYDESDIQNEEETYSADDDIDYDKYLKCLDEIDEKDLENINANDLIKEIELKQENEELDQLDHVKSDLEDFNSDISKLGKKLQKIEIKK